MEKHLSRARDCRGKWDSFRNQNVQIYKVLFFLSEVPIFSSEQNTLHYSEGNFNKVSSEHLETGGQNPVKTGRVESTHCYFYTANSVDAGNTISHKVSLKTPVQSVSIPSSLSHICWGVTLGWQRWAALGTKEGAGHAGWEQYLCFQMWLLGGMLRLLLLLQLGQLLPLHLH